MTFDIAIGQVLAEPTATMLLPPKPEFSVRSPGWESFVAKLKIGASCNFCLKKTGLEGHHITPFHLEPSLELEPANVVMLCRWCHFVVGHLGDWSRFNPLVLTMIDVGYPEAVSLRDAKQPRAATIRKLLGRARFAKLGLSVSHIMSAMSNVGA